MNADMLLEYYDRIADAPDAVARLRRFVLDLAVRGKLVPQDAGDEPAAVLLERISKQYHLKKLRKKFDLVDTINVPNGWAWARLGDVISLISGQHLQPNEYTAVDPSGLAYITGPSDFSSNGLKISRTALVRKAIAKEGQLLLTVKGSGLGKAVFCDLPEVAISRQLMALEPLGWNAQLMAIVVTQLSVHLQERARSLIPGIGRADVEDYPFLMPPLAEQRRIVAKVDELMALCDQLEAARKAREETRDRMAAASLARLNNPDPETFPSDARFALNTLPALTTRPDQVKQLRQTILNLAVRGKLVPQDAGDESATVLLAIAGAEKTKLLRNGEIPRSKVLPNISESEKSLPIPDNWAWVRLGDLCALVTSGSRDWAQHYSDEGAIFVRMGNLSKGHYHLRLDSIQYVKPPKDGEGTRTRLAAGDILISITGDVGMLGLVPEDFGESYINQHIAMVRPLPIMQGRYLAELFRSPFAQQQFNAPQRGIKNSFRLTDVTELVIPLPPLAEQRRIVAKVNELMALCDALEASLTAASTARARLLEATLQAALAPAAPLLNAAE